MTKPHSEDITGHVSTGGSSRALTLEELYARFGERILNLLYRFTRDEESARDLLQDVFLAAYQNLDTFEDRSHVSTWLHRIAVNRALNYLKREKRTFWFNVLDENVSTLLHRERSEAPGWRSSDLARPDELLESREFTRVLEESIGKLPPKYRAPFVLYREGDMSNTEIAAVLGLTVSAVETRIHRAKKLLSKTLRPYL